MGASNNVAQVMMNAGPWFGVGGGVAALAAIAHTETRLLTCAVMFALAAGSALRKYLFAAPTANEPAEYPFATGEVHPRDRDGGPHGL